MSAPSSYRTLLRPGVLVLVALGGAAGTLARAAIDEGIATPRGAFPWATWIVNVAGCLLVGLVVTASLERFADERWLRPLLATGFCGGLTTFSSLAVEVDRLVQAGQPLTALVYLTSSAAAGLAATVLGTSFVRARLRSTKEREAT